MKKRALPQFAIAVVTILTVSCGGEGTLPPTSPSPDGTMQCVLDREQVDGTLRIVVEIQDTAGKPLHREVTPASASGDIIWHAGWEGNSQIVLERERQDGQKPLRYVLAPGDDGSWSGRQE